MLTADTVTDAQIRELQQGIAGRVFPAAGMAHTELSEIWETCNIALYDSRVTAPPSFCSHATNPREARESARYKARAYCAEFLNARP